MNHDISLPLEMLGQSAECLQFQLIFQNTSGVKLLFPYPEIVGIRFGNRATMQESNWGTELLVNSTWAGFTLQPNEVKAIEYRVRPFTVESPHEDDDITDYSRWCVDLPAGEYLVWFQYHVGEDYFCPDSHYRFKDLLREAESEEAVVWIGEIMSNRLHMVRP